MKIIKISVWYNSGYQKTKIAPRWDAEIWYDDGTSKRLTDVNTTTIRELMSKAFRQISI